MGDASGRLQTIRAAETMKRFPLDAETFDAVPADDRDGVCRSAT